MHLSVYSDYKFEIEKKIIVLPTLVNSGTGKRDILLCQSKMIIFNKVLIFYVH